MTEPVVVLALGDLHIQPDNLADIEVYLKQLEKYLIRRKGIDLIMIMGDTLHTHEIIYTQCMNMMLEYIKLCETYAPTYILVGNHEYCFAEDTPIMMFDGSIKMSQSIRIGDVLMGDTRTPRNVVSIVSGHRKMYDIQQQDACTYTVSENHLLCLYSDEGTMDISVSDYLKLPASIQSKLYGYQEGTGSMTSISVVPSIKSQYYGWSTDGNHRFLLEDSTVVHNCNNQQFLSRNHPFVGWKTYNIVDQVVHLSIKNKNLILVPYVPDGRLQEALNTGVFDWKTANCIFAHQLLDGAKMGAITAKGIEEWKADYPMLVSGHIHDQQDPQQNLHYTGSSIQVSFGEREDHTASLVTIGDTTVIERINLHPPTKKTVYVDMSTLREMKIPEQENTKVKLSISGDAEDFKTFKKTQQYKDLLTKGVRVVFKHKRAYQPNLPVTNQRGFPDILFELVEKDPKLVDLYNQVLGQSAVAVEYAPEIVFED
jgi:DNA repair exonuclease SbcCD nuclease subunit